MNVKNLYNVCMDLGAIKKKYSRLGFTYLAGTLITNIIVYGGLFLVRKLFKSVAGNINLYFTVQMMIRFTLGYTAFIAIIHTMPRMKLAQNKLSAGRLLKIFLMVYAAGIISNVFGLITTLVFSIFKKFILPFSFPNSGFDFDLLDILTGINPLLSLIFVVILAPVFEELLFRKFLIDRIYGYGELPAILLSGLMFGLYHGNFQQFVYATTLGMIFAYVYLRTGRIGYTMILHALVNSIGSLVAGGLLRQTGIDFGEYFDSLLSGDLNGILKFSYDNSGAIVLLAAFEIFIFGLIIAGVVLWIITLAKRQIHLLHYIGEVPGGKRFTTAFLNWGIILYFIVYFGEIFYALLM